MKKYIALFFVLASIIFPCKGSAVNINGFRIYIRPSPTSESYVKIIHAKTKIGIQAKASKRDDTFQNWRLVTGPIWDTRHFLLSCNVEYYLDEIFSFNINRINPEQKQVIPEIILKSRYSMWNGTLSYRYFLPLEKEKNNFYIGVVDLRRKNSFLGHGYIGGKLILRTIPQNSATYLNFQINSGWSHQIIDLIRITMGYSFAVKYGERQSGKIYLTLRILV